VPPPVSLASTLVAEAEDVRRACWAGDTLSDDHCRVEYTAPRSMHTEYRDKVLRWFDGFRGGAHEEKIYAGVDAATKAPLAARRAARKDVAASEELYTRPPPEGEFGPARYVPRGPDALKALEEVVRRHGPDLQSRLRLEFLAQQVMGEARAAAKGGFREHSMAYLESIPKSAGPYAEARTQLAVFQAEKRDLTSARANYLAALELAPRSLTAAAGWALSCEGLGRAEEALEAWTRACALDARNPMLLMGKAGALFRMKRDAEAKDVCLEVLKIKPDERSARELLRRIELGTR
jgi:tetratricopeptide (TPR) repeat protein